MQCCVTRRQVISGIGATAAAALARPAFARTDDPVPELPTSPVALARCAGYGEELQPALSAMFDQLGGLRPLVEGRTVAIKINLVGDPWGRVSDLAPELTHWTHPAVIRSTIQLLEEAGASRIRVLECCGGTSGSLADYVRDASWNPDDLLNAASHVELVNTNGPGPDGNYARITCPAGGLVFPAYDLHPYYTDCDVFVSIPKLKEHKWFGVTLSMKNCYGMTPLNIYGDWAPEDAPGADLRGTRVSVFHSGTRAPSLTAPQEIDPESPRDGGYRIPRIVAEIASARPIHLAVIDGISSMAGGEGPWAPNARLVEPKVLLAGLNPVTTDAVAMAVMGFDPMADNGTTPFEGCDSFLRFAAELGLGTRDLALIEVRGATIEDARFDFRNARIPSA